MASTDSPSTMISIRPWRSTKCAGRRVNAEPVSIPRSTVAVASGGSTVSTSTAATQQIQTASPSRSPPTSTSTPARPLNIARRTTIPVLTRDAWVRYIVVCTARTTRYPVAKTSRSVVNACGIASAIMKLPTMPSSRKARRTGVTGGAALVSQA